VTDLSPHDPDAYARYEAELRKLRKINRVLMDRVERDMDAQGGDAYSLFGSSLSQVEGNKSSLPAMR
jgi:hypothetical protein